MSVYDLHAHSLCSDGTLTPAELVARAHAQGVRTLALTDHDTVAGIGAAGAAAATLGLELVPGVEISVHWETVTLHIVGLYIDPANATLQDGLAELLESRRQRALEIGARLAQCGVPDALAGAAAYGAGPSISRTHFARYLIETGCARDVQTAFKYYLGKGKPAYVPGNWATLAQALAWIDAARGFAVIAHPARYRLGNRKLNRLLGEFKALGGAGVEVVSGSHSREETTRFAALAVRYGLLASVGSDYHGPAVKLWAELGRLSPLPAVCTPVWQAWETARPSRALA